MTTIPLSALLTLIEDAARTARLADAHAAVLSAQMDLRAGQATTARDAAMEGLKGLTEFLHKPAPDPTANGRLKLTG